MTEAKRPPINDLRDWLKQVAEIGELCEVKEEVERDEEMSAIGYLLSCRQAKAFARHSL